MEVINPNLEVVTSSWKKINIANIRTNYHEIHRETGNSYIPTTPEEERIFHVCESMTVEDENQILLECHSYTHITSEFHSI